MDKKIYPTYKIAKLAAVLREQGVGTEALLAGTQLKPEDIYSNTTRISQRQQIAAYKNAVALSGDSSIGLIAGHRLGVTDYGFYGYTLLSSATLREALLFSIKYHQMAAPTVRMSLHVDEENAVVAFRMEDDINMESLYRFNIELQFGLVFSLFKEMVGPEFRFSKVCVKFCCDDNLRTYKEIFECEICFNQPYDELRFAIDWIDKPLVHANSITAQTTRELCDQTLLEMQQREGLSGDVYRVILSNIRNFGKEEMTASHLSMSARTLRRKLAGEGTSFQQILNEARSHLAVEYLTQSKFSIEEIADRLGFSDVTNFRHAFKRWTGKTTRAYRS